MTADTPARCEPPPELRGVDGWHWVHTASMTGPQAMRWKPGLGCWLWNDDHHWPHEITAWHYIGTITPPAEVEALRAEVMRASTECADAMAQVVALRARVARLEELVRSAYAEGWADGETRQYETAADRWEWAAARAALSAETP